MTKTATKIRALLPEEGWRGMATLYKVDPSIEVDVLGQPLPNGPTEYVVVNTIDIDTNLAELREQPGFCAMELLAAAIEKSMGREPEPLHGIESKMFAVTPTGQPYDRTPGGWVHLATAEGDDHAVTFKKIGYDLLAEEDAVPVAALPDEEVCQVTSNGIKCLAKATWQVQAGCAKCEIPLGPRLCDHHKKVIDAYWQSGRSIDLCQRHIGQMITHKEIVPV